MLLKVCLNGARARAEHPALPLTPVELAHVAQASVAAGAGAIHMHPRNASGAQSLAADEIGAAVVAVRAACPGVPLGVSTLFGILPDPARRVAAVRGWTILPDFASVNFGEPGTTELCAALHALGVKIEAGLDTPAAAEAYVHARMVGKCLRVLLEPGEQNAADALATAAAIEAILDAAEDTTPRLLHGEDAAAWQLLAAAAARGYDSRIGLEDVLTLPDGSAAHDNAALVAAAVEQLGALQQRK
jgi:uncharacterized protein (DUF849 family)